VDDSIVLEQDTARLEPGDVVVFYTDGVTDALNSEVKAFGDERLRQAVSANADGTAQEIAVGLLQAMQGFIGGAEPFDDITLMIAKRV
jgi:sigma-B regulation protein RsbU (phosphoserine phosphatase)